MKGKNDIELMLSVKGGDKGALSTLVTRYEKPLINFLFRMIGNLDEAEDLFQETFLRVLRSAERYEPKAAFSTWLYTIARNQCLDRLKKMKGLSTVPLEGKGEDEGSLREVLEAASPDPGDTASRNELAQVARGALRELPPKKREVLVLRIFQGLPYEEIARIVNAPLGTVKYRIHDAVKSLAERVEAALQSGEKATGASADP
ncbi:MAG: RNA polymerase sigma factor [Planctomycetota bacterium]|jgi:RNA polymerase sigma-70 factor (ECF subfamily)